MRNLIMDFALSRISVRPQRLVKRRLRIGWRRLSMFRSRPSGLVLLAIGVGLCVGLLVHLVTWLSMLLSTLLAGSPSWLSSTAPMRLFIAPIIGGALLALLCRQRQAAVDPLEASALRGGKLPIKDSARVIWQTIIANGCGASVGLEAAYAQCGAAIGSNCGSRLALKRSDTRVLLASGTAAAIAAAFGAPLTGAFYAFELLLASYSVSIGAAVLGASLAGTLVARALGGAPYKLAVPPVPVVTTTDYLLMIALGLLCGAIAIGAMRIVYQLEKLFGKCLSSRHRPIVGGLIVGSLGLILPDVLGSGHEAMNRVLLDRPTASVLLLLIIAKLAASLVTLASGFRGGLFFASLFIGSMIGTLAAVCVDPVLPVNVTLWALAGTASLGSAVLGTPLTMSFLVLESTHDFTATGPVLAAAMATNLFVRETFGFSFSTWRLHLRGTAITGATDIGWKSDITVRDLMLPRPRTARRDMTIAQFREQYPLGSAINNIVLVDSEDRYQGMAYAPAAHDPALDADAGRTAIGTLAKQNALTTLVTGSIEDAMATFDREGTDVLVVLSREGGPVVGLLRESTVTRRYALEIERSLQL